MSAGGVFTLIANEGRTDRLLLATALLNQRIHDIQCARRRSGKMDCWPTLVDIERTHVLFMNAHYKPFVAIGYEYNKVKVQNGTPGFGTTVTFSIPQFGDFFFDIVCRVQFSAWATLSDNLPHQFGNPLTFTSNSDGTKTYPHRPSETTNAFPLGFAPTNRDSSGMAANNLQGKGIGWYFQLIDGHEQVLANGGVAQNTAAPGQGEHVPLARSDRHSNCSRAFNNLVRWIEYPANRLFRRVWFNVNNNPLDEYNDIANIMYQKFCVPVGKEIGYNRMCGQEVPHDGWGPLKRHCVVETDSWGLPLFNYITGLKCHSHYESVLSDQHDDAMDLNDKHYNTRAEAEGFALAHLDHRVPLVARYLQKVVDGPQTPKEVQPPLEIMHKLHFWFNDDVRLAVPSVSIPYGQRFISMELAPVEDMAVQECNLFCRWIVCNTALQSLDGSEHKVAYGIHKDAANPANRAVGKSECYTYPYHVHLCNDEIKITSMELFINNIFVNPEIHDIYIRRIGFTLIRVHRTANIAIHDEGKGEKLISQLKWPIEYMFIGMRPKWNTDRRNPFMWRDWHRLTKVDTGFWRHPWWMDMYSNTGFTHADRAIGAASTELGETAGDKSTCHAMHLSRWATHRSTWAFETPSIDTLNVTAHGITLYDYFNTSFYNQYIPFHYGGYNINTPADPGALMVTFCLFPRTYQPSGHLNVSRAREFYLGWTSSYISHHKTAELLVVASAINFLLISDGSAVLRYST